MIDYAGIAKTFEKARKAKGWSKAALARAAGVSVCTVHALEKNGGRRVRLTKMFKLGDALKLKFILEIVPKS